MSRASTRGIALLEVIVALAILAIAATSGVQLLVQASDTFARRAVAEQRLADASRLLAAVSLLTRADLEARLGSRTAGPYLVTIRRVEPVLFGIEVRDREGAASAVLETLLYRLVPRP